MIIEWISSLSFFSKIFSEFLEAPENSQNSYIERNYFVCQLKFLTKDNKVFVTLIEFVVVIH